MRSLAFTTQPCASPVSAVDRQRTLQVGLLALVDAPCVLAWREWPDGSRGSFNATWLCYTGLSSRVAANWGWEDSVHPDDLEHVRSTSRRLRESGEGSDVEARLRRHDGEYRWFLCRAEPLHDEAHALLGWQWTATNIERLKQTERRLRQDEEELRGIIDAIPQTIVVLGPEGRAINANRTTLDYTGLSMDEVRAPTFRERVFHAEDVERLRTERGEALGRGLPFSFEQRARRRDGRFRWFLVQYNPLLDENGHILRWYATGTDIDDRKRAEDRVRNENLALREDVDRSSMFEEVVGRAASLQRVLGQVEKVAGTDSTVLILGETGTGKELIARAIHKNSKRSNRAFIRINCGAIAPSLVASELFGHEKGAFTGAVQRRVGRFESADGGTIFLDEIADLPSDTQASLLRVLQEREFERVGNSRPIPVDIRVLAATNRDLKWAVARGTFRQDLYYRLNVFPIELPALRDRPEDIPLLVEYLVDRFSRKAGRRLRRVEPRTMDLLQTYDWPGNVRELQNVVERSVILSDGDTFSVEEAWLRRDGEPRVQMSARERREEFSALSEQVRPSDEDTAPLRAAALSKGRAAHPLAPVESFEQDRNACLSLREQVGALERGVITRTLAAQSGNQSEAARRLGLSRGALIDRMRKYGLARGTSAAE